MVSPTCMAWGKRPYLLPDPQSVTPSAAHSGHIFLICGSRPKKYFRRWKNKGVNKLEQQNGNSDSPRRHEGHQDSSPCRPRQSGSAERESYMNVILSRRRRISHLPPLKTSEILRLLLRLTVARKTSLPS